ncbi:MAG: hypothetical protein FGM24_05320 [Candidatus Kapabacteria bacterium]|nr:hypothetical protein [Candidatus Kapabacteria bacterium]
MRAAERPRLVVVISYDQLRGDMPTTFARFVSQHGFERVKREGAWFDACYYDQAAMMTAPGHATLLTGCYPHRTGITGNDLCDRHTKTCSQSVEDATFGTAPVLLKVPALGDILRANSPRSKVVSMAFKDRAAVLMGGHEPTYALWFDTDSLAFVTSSYYQRPPWLNTLNDDVVARRYSGFTWRTGIADSLRPAYDDVLEEGDFSNGSRTFPHQLASADQREAFALDFLSSPFSVTYLFDAAVEVMRREQLGQDTIPDILAIGVSSTDILGHQFGPDSREVQEMYAGCDTTLARFINVLDERVGRANYVLVITSDHGVAPIPELLARQAEPQGTTVDAGRMRGADVRRTIDSALSATYGTPTRSSWISNFIPPSLFLDSATCAERNVTVDAAAVTVATAMRSIHGIAYAITHEELRRGILADTIPSSHARFILQAFHDERSGDVVFYPREYWIFGGNVATHGTPYDYDRHVPLMLFGAGIAGGRIGDRVAPVDIAPTLATMLGLQLDDVDGTPLSVVTAP